MMIALGLMSGTSLDGVDAALLRTDGASNIELGPTFFYPYPEDFQGRLKHSLGVFDHDSLISIEDELTRYHIIACQNLLKISKLKPDIIAFPGQTLYHKPRSNTPAFTYQIGDPYTLAKELNTAVIYDFRSNDIRHGGEGAPLVPVFQEFFFKSRIKGDICIVNIGGVANITHIQEKNPTVAYDTGPGMALINDWMMIHTQKKFDEQGELAQKGHIDEDLLKKWLSHSFFFKKPPKSLDRNTFCHVLHECHEKLNLEDGLATLVNFTSQSILRAASTTSPLLLCGGGRYNQSIVKLLKNGRGKVHLVDDFCISGDFLEAYAFAFLAVRSFKQMFLSYPTTTGVKRPVTGGVKILPPS